MVQCIEPNWEVRRATPAEDGHHIVYLLDVETKSGPRECVLKATPPDGPPTCDGEARLLAVLTAHTSLPVPAVRGVVDEHEALPAPFFLASTLAGRNYNRRQASDLSEPTLARLARSTGRHLAELHSLEAVDAYGIVTVDDGETLTGERPDADIESVGVADPTPSWRAYLESEVDRVLSGLAETRFGDLRSTVRPALETRIDGLSGEFSPVIARIDNSLDNVLVDPESGTVTGLLDWEFCVAATPAYDLAFVEHSLAGGHWRLLPGADDHRETIRPALLEGYRRAGEARVAGQFRENRDCYALLAGLHSMLNFGDWFDQVAPDVGDERREKAAERLREEVTNWDVT